MSSWHQHHATGVYGECCIGDCSPGDLCYYNWDRRGCPHNPVYNRFVTVGSIKYGVRVGAVSPPPPGARYRSTAAAAAAAAAAQAAAAAVVTGGGGGIDNGNTILHQHQQQQIHHYHHYRYESTLTPTPKPPPPTDKECCCNVVNLPWPRSVASVSRIPLLADKQQLSINSCGIFSSVNSADVSNGYAGCSSLPLVEREHDRDRDRAECEQTIKQQHHHHHQNDTNSKSSNIPTAAVVVATAAAATTATASSSSTSVAIAPTDTTDRDRDTVYRSRPSWSHPPQFGLRSCVSQTEQHFRFSSSTATQLFLQRRRALVRSRSDADAAAANIHINVDHTTDETIALTTNDLDTRRDTLDRLHRFRFGGNRTNIRAKKTRSDDKSERFRELTDRLKSATHLAAASTSASATATASSSSNTTPSLQKTTPLTDDHIFSNQLDGGAISPIPPPRTRHSQGSNCSLRTSNPTVTCSPSAITSTITTSSTCTSASSNTTSADASTSTTVPSVVPTTPSPPPPPQQQQPQQSPKSLSPSVIDEPTIIESPPTNQKPETSNTYNIQQRTIPFRSASFSLVDFSSDGKYFRKQNTGTDKKQDHTSDSVNRVALTLPRKKENQIRYFNSSSLTTTQHHHQSPRNNNNNNNNNTITDLSETSELHETSNENCEQRIDNNTSDNNLKQQLRVSDISADSTTSASAANVSTEEKKRDRSRRRKGMYISQWPDQRASVMLAYAQEEEIASTLGEAVSALKPPPEYDEYCANRDSIDETETTSNSHVLKRTDSNVTQNSAEDTPHKVEQQQPHKGTNTFTRVDSFSEGEDQNDRRPLTPIPQNNSSRDLLASPMLTSPSDVSDTESSRTSAGNDSLSPNVPRRYSKRPLRGPYGQMLEAEMKRPDTNKTFSKHHYSNELKFLDDHSSSTNIVASMMSLPSVKSVMTAEDKSKVLGRLRGTSNHSLDDSNIKNSSNIIGSSTGFSMNTSKNKLINSDVSSSSAPTSIPGGFCDIETDQRRLFACHQRTTSSPSKLEEIMLPNAINDRAASAEPSSDFLCDFLNTSSEQLTTTPTPTPTTTTIPTTTTTTTTTTTGENISVTVPGSIPDDTRTHIVVELYETERSYVESLQILVMKYQEPLKSAENSLLLDAALVDEIFYQVPALLSFHQEFLEELKKRLEHWDAKQKIGDVFLDLTKAAVVETYTSFINNWKRAKEVIKTTSQAKPAFARFLEAMAREHKGKLALDSLLIKPVQKFPKYELLIQRLIKHTDSSHPDYPLLLEAQKEIHENLIKINCTERETVEYEQQQQNLKDLENLVEGLVNLVTADRIYLRHDLVTMTSGQGTRKERALFLFSDLLVITSIKRRSGTIKKPPGNCPGSVMGTLDANKYKLLMRIPLDDLEIMKGKDENVRRVMQEIENLQEDIASLSQINDIIWTLHCPKPQLEDVVREMLASLNRQLTEQQNSDSQLSYLDLTLNTSSGVEHLSIVFSQPEKRANWEESFNEAKQKLAISVDRRPSPEFLAPVPIRKTRAGLQFTCAAPTLSSASNGVRDVWVCNSDGYVGQVCVLSLHPEPTVTSCNGVCNARILCVASVPAGTNNCIRSTRKVPTTNAEDEENRSTNIQLDSSSSSADEEDSEREDCVQNSRRGSPLNRGKSAETASTDSSDDMDNQQPTMWLGTEDGCIHVYNCNDNIRIKKNKIRLQHSSSILCIIYLDNRVFVSMANGDITIYSRDQNGGWNTSAPITVSVSSAMMPVNKMLPNSGKLWCSCNNSIKILNIHMLTVEHTFQTNSDQNKSITCMVMSGLGVWLSLHNSAIIKCFHSLTYDFLCEVNMAPAVTKMLTSCDDIIRQHKAACLRVTSLLACKDLLWVGTSAGVLLTMPLPHITTSTTKISIIPSITGVPHGHTGHVRFLTSMESPNATNTTTGNAQPPEQQQQYNNKLLVISGGDGYEDFRSSNMSDIAGREDSTNHLLLWHV